MLRTGKQIAGIFLALVMIIAMTPFAGGVGSVFAAAGTEAGTVGITPAVELYNSQVRLSWDFNEAFRAGTYVERFDTSSKGTRNVGDVSSDYSYRAFTDTSPEAGATYRYRLVNGAETSNWSSDITVPKQEAPQETGESGEKSSSTDNTSDSDNQSSTESEDDVTPPDIQELTVSSVSSAPGKATVSGYWYYDDATWLEVKQAGKVIMNRKVYGNFKKTVSIPYDKTTVFECRVYTKSSKGKKLYAKKYMKLTQKSLKLGKPQQLFATKISANKVSLIWSSVNGATGFEVYQNSKKIKTLKKTSFMYSKKGAGKGTYKVIPYFIQSGKTFKGGSKSAKPKANVATYSNNLDPHAYEALTCKFIITKVELTGKTYKVTGYAINGSLQTTCNGYRSLKITLKQDGKTLASKTVKKNFKVKPLSKKKLTFKISGKAGKDIRGISLRWHTNVSEKW